ncbi:hypothetical protein KIL84_005946 [Mauremys mutica]|uniref:Uncharacterized protein n=1 Tax=Mauremys mutica TaxID=74926 RepID=A0A9D4B490_9SAUR|nr:hypothetical protein KIL84_005946 [Mauremys mutica]
MLRLHCTQAGTREQYSPVTHMGKGATCPHTPSQLSAPSGTRSSQRWPVPRPPVHRASRAALAITSQGWRLKARWPRVSCWGPTSPGLRHWEPGPISPCQRPLLTHHLLYDPQGKVQAPRGSLPLAGNRPAQGAPQGRLTPPPRL